MKPSSLFLSRFIVIIFLVLFEQFAYAGGRKCQKLKPETVREEDAKIIPSDDDFLLLPNRKCTTDNRLFITATSIVEKALIPDDRPMMKISLWAQTPKKKGEITFTSDSPNFFWEDYEFTYIGGWRNKVMIKIVRINKNKK